MSWFSNPAALVAAALLAVPALAVRARGLTGRRRLAASGLRAAAVACAALAAAGFLEPTPAARPRVELLQDVSASVGPRRARAAADFVEAARRAVLPGVDLAVRRFPGSPAAAARGTDIESALRQAAERFPAGGDNRVVLLTDGRENLGSALAAVPELRRLGVRVFPVDLSGVPQDGALLRRVVAPLRLIPGEKSQVRVVYAHEGRGRAAARLERAGAPAALEEAAFEGPGERELVFPIEAGPPGVARYRVRFTAPGVEGAVPQERDVEIPVVAPPPVTVVAGEPAEAAALAGVLARAGVPADVRGAEDWLLDPADPPEGAVLILDNVAPRQLGAAGAERLERLVRERGLGLLAIGGPGAFDQDELAGTPLERLLPVQAGAPAGAPERGLALVIVVDSSLSMFYYGRVGGAFHRSTTPRKIDAAKSAVLEMARALRPGDQLGLLESKDRLYWVQPLGPPGDFAEFERKVLAIRAIGAGINFYSSVLEARAALRASGSPLRMVMVVCDTNDIDQLSVEQVGDSPDLVRAMAEEGITVSIFSIGFPTDKDVPFLKSMAALGRGDFYLVSNTAALPRYLRAEYARKTGESVREEQVQPLVRDFDRVLLDVDPNGLPAVRTMHQLTARRGSTQVLIAPSGAPLLATWGYGRGRSAVFASDDGTRWAPAWTSWPDAGRFWRQLVYGLASRARPRGPDARGEYDPATGRLTVRARAADGSLLEDGPAQAVLLRGGARTPVPLERGGLERFVGAAPGLAPGTWELELGAGAAAPVGTVEVPAPPEQGDAATGGGALLEALARETGGAVVADPAAALPAVPAPGRRPPPAALPWLLGASMLAIFGELVLRR